MSDEPVSLQSERLKRTPALRKDEFVREMQVILGEKPSMTMEEARGKWAAMKDVLRARARAGDEFADWGADMIDLIERANDGDKAARRYLDAELGKGIVCRPIVFTKWSIRRILDGEKSQTRRPLRDDVGMFEIGIDWRWRQRANGRWVNCSPMMDDAAWIAWDVKNDERAGVACPYGQVGDQLWVRERWARGSECDTQATWIPQGCRDAKFVYEEEFDECHELQAWKWRPSMFMPREAARIRLEVTDVRVERLKDITVADARAEGIDVFRDGQTEADLFIEKWDSVAKRKPENQASANPFVFAVMFKLLEVKE